MDWAIDFLLRHNYWVLFLFVFAEQNGIPAPALPILLAAGALAAAGRMSVSLALLTAITACLVANTIWYMLGRSRGTSILKLICRISLEPDSCVRTTESVFARHGALSLIYAKFVPGLAIVAPPLAGLFRMGLLRFLALDALGATLWAVTFGGLGYLFSEQLELIAVPALKLGGGLVVALPGGLGVYILWKYFERRRFVRHRQVARISPEELAEKVSAGKDILVLDLRHSHEPEYAQASLPGLVRITPDQVEDRVRKLPKDQEIVLFCT
jgi:membrane protein DedA with SNARE-associated domain